MQVMIFHRRDVAAPASEFLDVAVQEFNMVRVRCPHGPIRVHHAFPRVGPAKLSVRQQIHKHDRPDGVKGSHPLLQAAADRGVLQRQSSQRGSPSHRSPAAMKQQMEWSLNFSVFSSRRKECDSRSFLDEPRMLEAACAADWELMKIPYEFQQKEEYVKALEAHLHKNFEWYAALFRQVRTCVCACVREHACSHVRVLMRRAA